MYFSSKSTPFIGLATLLALGLAAASPASAQNLVHDGSFDDSVTSPFQTYSIGQTFGAANEWHVASGDVDVINGYWTSYDGPQSVDLNGLQNGSIYQDLTTTPGATYNLSYWLAGNPDRGPVVKTLDVSIGNVASTVTFDTTGHSDSSLGWTQKNLTFTATGTSTRLQFTSVDDPSSASGPALDNVSVTVAPEPSAFAPFAFAALGLGALVLRAKKRTASAL